MVISIQNNNVSYSKGTFTVSGKETKFRTEYFLKNELTGNEVKFKLREATGSEWDSNTIWIYESLDGEYTLNILNDDVTPQHAENYLKAKMR